MVPAVVLSVVYAATLQRSTGNAVSVDTTKFTYLGQVLGTGHPPGYPLYTLLNAAVVRAVPVGSVATRANLLSAVFAVVACVVAVRVLRDLDVPRPLAAGGATALGMVPAFWRNAVVAEVYTFTALFIMVVLACVVVFDRTGHRGWLRAGLLVYALSFAHATMTVLLMPGLLLYLAGKRATWLLRPREVITLLPAGTVLALGPYAYLAWRTAVGSAYLETRVDGVPSLWRTISGARFGNRMFSVPWDQVVSERLPTLGTAAVAEFGPLLALSAIGLLALAWRRPWVAALTTAWLLGTAVFVLQYAVNDWLTLLLPVWLTLGLWAVLGTAWFASACGRWAAPVAAVTAVALALGALASGYADADRSGGPDPQKPVDAAVAAVPDGSLIFTRNFETRHQFGYRLLPGRLGERRNVWAAKGAIYAHVPDQMVFRIQQYCRDRPGPWVWPYQEQPMAPSVPRGLKTFVYGDKYAEQVRARGFTVAPFSGQLYRVSCER